MSLQARDDLDRHQRLGRERRFQFIAAVIERVVQRVLDRVHIFQLLQILGPVQREVIAESVHRPCTHRILLAYFCVFTTCIAAAIKPLISPRLAGMMMELLVLASCANAFTYCSATFRLTASEPPGDWIAAPTSRSAAVASAGATMAAACPCARLMAACFSPSERAIDASRSPVAMLICSCLRPSEAAISARFSRSAVICACIACRISLGGVRSLIS